MVLLVLVAPPHIRTFVLTLTTLVRMLEVKIAAVDKANEGLLKGTWSSDRQVHALTAYRPLPRSVSSCQPVPQPGQG